MHHARLIKFDSQQNLNGTEQNLQFYIIKLNPNAQLNICNKKKNKAKYILEHLSRPLSKKESFKRRTHFKIRNFLFEPPYKINNCWNFLNNNWLNEQTLNHFKVNQKNLSDATLPITHSL